MASLREAAEQLTAGLDELVGQMRKELTEGDVDFERLGGIADEISERAGGIAETFGTVNDTLMQRISAFRSEGEGARSGADKDKSAKASGGRGGGGSGDDSGASD